MPKWITSLFVFFLSTILFTAKAKSTDLILHNHIEAMGGIQTVQKMKRLYEEGKIRLNNESIIILSKFLKGIRYDFSEGQLKSQEQSLKRLGLGNVGVLTDLALEGNNGNIQLVNQEYINGIKCYKLKLSLNRALEVNYYINSQNWYIIRETRHHLHGEPANKVKEVIINYSNYKEVNGFIFPEIVEMTIASQDLY